MHIIKVGFNHKIAPVEIREKMTFPENELANAITSLNNEKSVLENVIVSTCNRTEIFAVVDQLHTGRYYIKSFLEKWFQMEKESFVSYLHIEENEHAIEHLFQLVAGLDSMVLGETQILGQVRDAFLTAQQAQATGTIFNELFKQAISFAKRAHSETAIGENAVSVSYAAVELAKKIFGKIHEMHVVILGAGKMGELAAKNLHGSGVHRITVVNRTLSKAEELAKTFHGKAAAITDLQQILTDADILISSTGSDSVVLSKEELAPVQKKRKGRPLFLVDIAVPRDIDPTIGSLDNVFLYDIDDLQHIVDENLAAREAAAIKIKSMIGLELEVFNNWLTTLGVVPVISALRQKALTIQAETMKSIERKMPDLTEREKKVLSKHTKSIINQLLKDPITQAKELAGKDDPEQALALFINIFGIEKEVAAEKNKHTKKNEKMIESNPNSSFSSLERMPTN
ncbi:glutamyl-tRNA reductase [Virgibacillus sp. MG-45]|uniref:glutamyl-tRNA reductase n=1 Tax=Virgibacillus sp. MG-45 TaxID=3102791 RepID=UPI002ED88762